MPTAICWKCVEDEILREEIRSAGKPLPCAECDGTKRRAFSVRQIAQQVAPVIEEHFRHGGERRVFDGADDDRGWYEQEGDDLTYVVQTVLGQYFECQGEIISEVCEQEDVWPPDGDQPFFGDDINYVEKKISASSYHSEWDRVLHELKFNRRFFNERAETFFDRLFTGVDGLTAWREEMKQRTPVVAVLPVGTELYRARICGSDWQRDEFFKDPGAHLGPPPSEAARAGRMNAQGVVVLYGAMESETALAEMRSAIGAETVVAKFRATRELRVLDFSLLDSSSDEKALSYFDNGLKERVSKGEFLRELHGLISAPVIPGREADYLITQMMTEYLAHVIFPPFDGIAFKSSQMSSGTNIVLFRGLGGEFPVEIVANSAQLFRTFAINYGHEPLNADLMDGRVRLWNERIEEYEEDEY